MYFQTSFKLKLPSWMLDDLCRGSPITNSASSHQPPSRVPSSAPDTVSWARRLRGLFCRLKSTCWLTLWAFNILLRVKKQHPLLLWSRKKSKTLLHSKSQYTTVKHSRKLFEHTYRSDPHGLGTLTPIEFFQHDLLWNTHSHSCSQKASKHTRSILVGLSVNLHTTTALRRIVHH
jgi:hypothetical protein